MFLHLKQLRKHNEETLVLDARDPGRTLPYDTVLQVVAYLEAESRKKQESWISAKLALQTTLCGTCLINREWYEASVRVLYKEVLLPNKKSLRAFAHTLKKREDLRPLVYSIFYARTLYSRKADEAEGSDYGQALDRIYAMCPNTHSPIMKVPINSTWYHPRYSSGWYLPKRLLNRARRAYDQQFTELSFDTITRFEVEQFGHSSFFTTSLCFASLEDLTIKYYHQPEDRSGGLETRLDWPDMPRLRRLCLYKCRGPVRTNIPLPTSNSLKAGLRSLEIIGGVYWNARRWWFEIMSAHYPLEVLTFAPSDAQHVQLSTSKEILQYTMPPSLISLCISVESFEALWPVWFFYRGRLESIRLSRSLRRLTFIQMSHGTSGSILQDKVLELLTYHHLREFCPHLKTIVLCGRPPRLGRTVRRDLREKAAEDDIRVVMTWHCT